VMPELRAYAIKRLRDTAAAEDVVNEACAKALRFWEQFAPGTNFKSWMYRILHNEMISMFRRTKKHAALSMNDEEHPIDAAIEARQDNLSDRESVRRAMKLLPVQFRHVLLRICVEGRSYEEVAAEIDVSVGTIKSRLWRARSAMESMLVMS